jgi:hypothetical protein
MLNNYQMTGYIIFAFLVVLFLGPPIYLWFRWIKAAIKNRNTISKIASMSSFLVFISAIVVWFGPRKLYELNSIKLFSSVPIILFLFVVSFIIPLIYFYARWVYQAVKMRKVSTILFRLSFLLIFLIYFKYLSVSSELKSRNDIGRDLGITIPYWGTSFISFDENVTLFRNEGKINATLKLSDKSANLLTNQISKSKYFSLKQVELVYSEDNHWPEQDSIKYWSVRSYLEKSKRTGLWVYNSKKAVYDFYEPSLSDIPNASLMFNEDYVISAEFNPKTKILTYKRFKF